MLEWVAPHQALPLCAMDQVGLAFDRVAEEYNRYRSAYPLDFIKSVLATLPGHAPGEVCEIGCGSGQATIRLAELGYKVTAIEPGPELLKLAQRNIENSKHVKFVGATFELAALKNDSFDLIFAANSLHWVSPELRFKKPFTILKPGGHMLAVWRWNHPFSGPVSKVLDRFLTSCVSGWTSDSREDFEQYSLSFFRAMIELRCFWQCQLRRIPYEFEMTSEGYSNWLSTMAKVAALSPEVRRKTLEGVRQRIDNLGGRLYQSGETVIIVGRKPWCA